jgi:hypothetical protein
MTSRRQPQPPVLCSLNLTPYDAQAAAVDAAATRAVELIKYYAEQESGGETKKNHHNNSNDDDDDDNDEINSAWQHPETIYDELDRARTELSQAWDELQRAINANQSNVTETTTTVVNEEDLRVAYMDMITDAFADVLNDLKESEGEGMIDVDVLVDCLQSGLDLMSQDEKEFFMQDSTRKNGTGDEDGHTEDLMTPHEVRRRQLGFHVDNSS